MEIKERPILFSTPMVQAITDGRKTETRRIIKWPRTPEWHDWDYEPNILIAPKGGDYWPFVDYKGFDGKGRYRDIQKMLKCPYGEAGDILWVRESFANGQNGSLDDNHEKDEKDWSIRYWIFKDGAQKFSTGEYFPSTKPIDVSKIKWKPSIHMPREAARIFLEVVESKAERVQDITQESAEAEGVAIDDEGLNCYDYIRKTFTDIVPEDSFETLWRSINGDESWETNPWVWVVKFKCLEIISSNILKNT